MLKYRFLPAILILIGSVFLQAKGQQVPEGINFQGVARDNAGSELVNYDIDVKTIIVRNNPSGEEIYTEVHQVETDLYGLFSLVIGKGTHISGTDFSSINWGSDDMFLKVEMDFGEGFQHVSTSQFLSVPYALYAKTAGSSEDNHSFSFNESTNVLSFDDQPAADLSSLKQNAYVFKEDTLNELQEIYLEDDQLFLSKNSSGEPVSLNKYLDNTDEQQLSLSGNQLSLTNGGTVSLSLASDNDLDSLNEIQSLTLEDNELTLSGSPNSNISLNKYLDNTDNQKIKIEGRTISLENGGSITLPNDETEDSDADSTNEIQTLSLLDTDLILSGLTEPGIISLGAFMDNTDNQQLSINGKNISLTNGGTIALPEDQVNDADSDPANELQTLSLDGDILSLEGASDASTVNLNKFADNTDKQKISIAGNIISLENGGNITLPADKTEDADANATNELQDLTFSNGKLSLSKSAVEVDLNTEFIAFSAHRSSYLTVTTNNQIVIGNYNQETYDPNDLFDAIGGDFTVPDDGGGYYRITFAASVNSSMESKALDFTIIVAESPVYEARATIINTTFIKEMIPGSTIYVIVGNNQGNDINLTHVSLSAERVFPRY